MEPTVQNPSFPDIMPNSIGLYDNGHFSSALENQPEPFTYDSLQTFIEIKSPSCKLEFSDFDTDFEFEVSDVEGSLDSNEIILYLNLDNQVTLKATLEGTWEKSKANGIPNFQTKNFGLRLVEKLETPISTFLSSTLWAMLGLSTKFKFTFPIFNDYYLNASFELPVDEISKLLQERQIAYRLLVIETALGIELPFPQEPIDGKDVENIAFCYKAIVDRKFKWPAPLIFSPLQANKENLTSFPETNEPIPIIVGQELVIKTIFGSQINLGIMGFREENSVIDNYNEAKEHLQSLDNEIVTIERRPINGTITIISADIPHLPQNPWSEKLQKLIDLESKLDEMILDRYFTLASSTLEGLTEEQKKEITKRPDLDEEAFDF
jgi:hypothetical protein